MILEKIDGGKIKAEIERIQQMIEKLTKNMDKLIEIRKAFYWYLDYKSQATGAIPTAQAQKYYNWAKKYPELVLYWGEQRRNNFVSREAQTKDFETESREYAEAAKKTREYSEILTLLKPYFK